MSRRKAKHARRRRARERQLDDEARELVESLEAGGMPVGLSRERAIEIANDAANSILRLATERGQARREAWGLAVNPHMLTSTIEAGLRLLREVEKALTGDPEAESLAELMRGMPEDETAAHAFAMISGTVTIVGAALVLLESSPFPPDMMKIFRAVTIEEVIERSRGETH